MSDDLSQRLADEADLCRNDGADDIAALLDETVRAIAHLKEQVEHATADACRYRWMRRPVTSLNGIRELQRIVGDLCEGDMDAAIDADMDAGRL